MAKCVRCGRKLNNPISIARGIGAECAGNKTSAPKINKNWKRKVINTSKIRHGECFEIGNKAEQLIVMPENFERVKGWLEKYNFILKEGDVSDDILDVVYEHPEQIFYEGALNEKGEK